MNDADWALIEDTLAAGDPDRTVSTFFAPASRRRALMALYAFDVEVERIGFAAREPMAGHIRLAWWREQIDAIFSGGHVEAPVGRALAGVVRTHALPKGLFDAYLAARALDVEELPFADEPALEAHADCTSGYVVRLAAQIVGSEDGGDDAVRQAGLALALAGHIRDFAAFVSRRRCRLPVAWLEDAGINGEDVFAARGDIPALSAVLGRAKAKGRAALAALNASRFPRTATAVLAPATLARRVLRRSFDPFRPREMPAWERVARLSIANLAWRF